MTFRFSFQTSSHLTGEPPEGGLRVEVTLLAEDLPSAQQKLVDVMGTPPEGQTLTMWVTGIEEQELSSL